MTKLNEHEKAALEEVVKNLAQSSTLLAEAARQMTIGSLRVLGLSVNPATTDEAVAKLAVADKDQPPIRREALEVARTLSQHAVKVSAAAPDIAVAAPNFAVAAYTS